MLRLKDDLQTGVYCLSYPVNGKSSLGISLFNDPAKPLMTLHDKSLVLSVLKSPLNPDESGFVARVFNASDEAVAADISVAVPISGCVETNLLEETKETIQNTSGIIRLDFRPYEIKTLLFRL